MRCRRLFALLALSSCGCFGGTANPSYFPFLLPPGDVIPTHARPAGQGYFNDFDPKAASVEVTPAACSAAVNTDHVLIATVFDADGVWDDSAAGAINSPGAAHGARAAV